MKKIAEDVHLLDGFPPNAINVYLIGDVLLDAGTRLAKNRVLRELKGRTVTAHALTHAHPDHQGASKAVCEALNIPLWCGEKDKLAMETGDLTSVLPDNWNTRLQNMLWTGAGHPVARVLREGDTVAGFTIIDAPGHSPGQVAYWRESDRLLILGDVLNGMNLLTGVTGLHEPPKLFTVDPALNRDSARKLAKLKPDLVCFGHGRPWRDGEAFVRFVEGLAK